MVVLPPSRTSKGVYRWVHEMEPADPPRWLLEAVGGNRRPAGGSRSPRVSSPTTPSADEEFKRPASSHPQPAGPAGPRVDRHRHGDLAGHGSLPSLVLVCSTSGARSGRAPPATTPPEPGRSGRRSQRPPPDRIGAGTLIYRATQADPTWGDRVEDAAWAEFLSKKFQRKRESSMTVIRLPDSDDETEVEATAPPFSEEALALEFVRRHVEGVRYVALWNRWMYFDLTHWREDVYLPHIRRGPRDLPRRCQCGEQEGRGGEAPCCREDPCRRRQPVERRPGAGSDDRPVGRRRHSHQHADRHREPHDRSSGTSRAGRTT